MHISPNFTLEQMLFDPLATRLQLNEQFKPTPSVITALTETANFLCEPLHKRFGNVTIISAYKSKHLSFLYRENDVSGHSWGRAIDFVIPGYNTWDVFQWCKTNLVFNTLVAEYMDKNDPHQGWIHASYITSKQNGQKISYRLSKVNSKTGIEEYDE